MNDQEKPAVLPAGYPAFGEDERARLRPRLNKGKGLGPYEEATHFLPRDSDFTACGYHKGTPVRMTNHPYWSDCPMCRSTDELAEAQAGFDRVHGSYERWVAAQ